VVCEICTEVIIKPGYIDRGIGAGWGAGGNSAFALDGNLSLNNIKPNAHCSGVVVGLRTQRDVNYDPALIEHGFFFTKGGGSVVESGETPIGFGYGSTDTFEIRRTNGTVSYFQNTTLIYTSSVPSLGVKIATACLYVTGDEVQ
jgi:hypothetical protein